MTLYKTPPSVDQSEVVIDVRNITKTFKLYPNPMTGHLKEALFFWREPDCKRFVAVDDVSFQVRRGEVVGILGPNGAGKTTLLKIVAGLQGSDRGSVLTKGRVSALLALGVGVHPEFSGSENAIYGAMLMGASKKEAIEKLPEIIEFSELGDFIYQPFRTYSSGMKARLLFAISMSVNHEILIVDEALATGDIAFVKKCMRKIEKLCKQGMTVLFVSHNMQQVLRLCQRAIFMAHGKILADGPPSDVYDKYFNWVFQEEERRLCNVEGSGLYALRGTGEVHLEKVVLCDGQDNEKSAFETGEVMKVKMAVQISPNKKKLHAFVGFIDSATGQFVAEVSSRHFLDINNHKFRSYVDGIDVGDRASLVVTIDPLCLFNGSYSLWVIVFDSESMEILCEYRDAAKLFVGVKHAPMRRDIVCSLPVREWSSEL